MLPNTILRITLWVVCLFSLLTNLFVIASRVQSLIPVIGNMFSSAVSDKQNAFLINLAVADFLTGLYLLAIGIADAIFGKAYFLSALGWRKGLICKGIGFVGFLANIASILTLTFVSVERFFVIVFPFSKIRFRSKLTVTICVTIWAISGAMAITPIVLSEFVEKVFGFSDICLGLPFVYVTEISKYPSLNMEYNFNGVVLQTVYYNNDVQGVQWLYSQIVYVYFSATCVLVITICYIAIIISTIATKRQSGRPGNNKNELKLALRVAIIVGTDLLCWFPVILIGLLSQIGTIVSTDTYAWFAVFVMPINSAFNPFIYTIPAMQSKKRNETSFAA
ncbi:hypothetical protein HOLleu_10068 [Holothuria leucospilota]|uniref:G-protein coupled receptors family 1 profile domain-containing protein n=1 Tax=Holothuria leucospilota TaxID=206669 RepID=A0A9Q1HFG3_HOLLE|nr:hypothetical protein HOLleu_10068 [Holothuria leucospilota]